MLSTMLLPRRTSLIDRGREKERGREGEVEGIIVFLFCFFISNSFDRRDELIFVALE